MALRRVRNSESERYVAASLITLLLQERLRRSVDDPLSGEYEWQIRNAISHALLWRHSEAGGDKYNACRYWSDGAKQSREDYAVADKSDRKAKAPTLYHHHLFPRKQMIEKLFSLPEPEADQVKEILDRLNIAVIVTSEEHDDLHKKTESSVSEVDESDLWAKYYEAGLQCHDRHEQESACQK